MVIFIAASALLFLQEEQTDRKTFEAVCGRCHSPSMISGMRTEGEWNETIEVMVSAGAKGTEEQFARIRRHLARNYTVVNVNTADAPQIAPVLEITPEAAQSVVAYRTAHGNFKTLDDLSKVPGLNASKLAARKEHIAFR